MALSQSLVHLAKQASLRLTRFAGGGLSDVDALSATQAGGMAKKS